MGGAVPSMYNNESFKSDYYIELSEVSAAKGILSVVLLFRFSVDLLPANAITPRETQLLGYIGIV